MKSYNKDRGVYKIVNIKTDKRYYSASDCLEEKLKEEYQDMTLGMHMIPAINQDVKKYGVKAFKIEIIYNCLMDQTGEVVETLVNINAALARCYNKPSKIIRLSEEQKKLFIKKKKQSGRSEQTKRKISQRLRGTTKSDQTKQKISIAMKKPQLRVICPHCNKEGGVSPMTRYHFDNCREKHQ